VIRKLFRMVKRTVGAEGITDHADQRPTYLPGDKFALVVREMFRAGHYPELAKTVEAVLRGVNTEEDQIKALHVWYDQVMERVTGWYKRHAQAWVRALAVIVVVVLNADTLQITSLLWTNPALRQKVVEEATASVHQPPPETVPINYTDTDETASAEVPEVGTPGDSSDKHFGVTTEQQQLLNQVGNWDEDRKALDEALKDWEANKAANPNIGSKRGVYVTWMGKVLGRHALGWFVSMVAVSLGAPFWFGALNRLVNIRSAGKEPAKQGAATA